MSDLITGGLVSYEDGVKAREDYAPAKKAKVELSFTVPEGGNAEIALAQAATIAKDKVYALIGKAIEAPGVTTPALPLQPPMAAWEGHHNPPLFGGKLTDAIAQTASALVEAKMGDADAPRARRSRRTAAAEIPEDTRPSLSTRLPITDADLTKAASIAAGTHGPDAVKAIMAKYTQTGSLGSIPQESRKGFLEALGNM